MSDFHREMAESYDFGVPTIGLGRPYLDPEEIDTEVEVGIPLGLLNRHGLIAGAITIGFAKALSAPDIDVEHVDFVVPRRDLTRGSDQKRPVGKPPVRVIGGQAKRADQNPNPTLGGCIAQGG